MPLKGIFLFVSLLLIIVSVEGQKRGLSYGYNNPEDLEVMSPQISWWYNWSEAPESKVADVYGNYGFEFVPMTWNGSFNESKLRNFLDEHPETKYLLAFNEPNFIEQANMKPSAVAALWPRLEKIADDYKLKIVSPAVNFCGTCVRENGVHYTDPVKYLDDFFAACPDCRVDHIAVHCYMNHVSALEWYVGLFKKYGKPIWLTEFAGWESNGTINSAEDQINFMMNAMEYLESDTSIFRYSWFIGRGSGISSYPFIDILGSKGELTALGEVYKNMPVHNENIVVNVPARIEAESYTKMKGISLERTSDISGFANVGYIDKGDWLEYKINVPETSDYPIKFRLASTKAATLRVLVDGKGVKTIKIPNYNGWQNWNTLSDEINLEVGEHKLKLGASSSGFNINWFQIGEIATSVINQLEGKSRFEVFPNPSSGIINIETNIELEKLDVYNMVGEKVRSFRFKEKINVEGLPEGIYFISGLDKQGKSLVRKKILIVD